MKAVTADQPTGPSPEELKKIEEAKKNLAKYKVIEKKKSEVKGLSLKD
jgi:hypothetical protein